MVGHLVLQFGDGVEGLAVEGVFYLLAGTMKVTWMRSGLEYRCCRRLWRKHVTWLNIVYPEHQK